MGTIQLKAPRAVIAVLLAGVVAITPAVATVGAGTATAATVDAAAGDSLKRVKTRVKALRRQVQMLATQLQALEGRPPAAGPAGGDLTGEYPNPLLGGDSVGSPEISGSAVGAAEIADGAVGAPEIADGTVGHAEIGSFSVGASELKVLEEAVGSGVGVSAGQPATAHVLCPPGSVAISGGHSWRDDEPNSIIHSTPSETLTRVWSVRGIVDAGSNVLYAWANCLPT